MNPIPDTPYWSAPDFPIMAAEDEAVVIQGVSVSDPDGEEHLRIEISAEKGNVMLSRASSRELLQIEQGIREQADGGETVVIVGAEDALNKVLAGLVYHPPPDWTSFKEVRAIDGVEQYAVAL